MKLWITLVLSLSLISCAQLPSPPNVEVCVELPSENAFCTYTLNDNERTIPKEEWQVLRKGRFSMSANDFAKYQSFIDAVCIEYTCTVEHKKIIERLNKLYVEKPN